MEHVLTLPRVRLRIRRPDPRAILWFLMGYSTIGMAVLSIAHGVTDSRWALIAVPFYLIDIVMELGRSKSYGWTDRWRHYASGLPGGLLVTIILAGAGFTSVLIIPVAIVYIVTNIIDRRIPKGNGPDSDA